MMTQKELTARNLGESIDALVNVDPRGDGVCRILYTAARRKAGAPLCMGAAKLIHGNVGEGDLVYLMTGFVLPPFRKAEMDGIVSTVMLARALVKAYGARPVIVCHEDCLRAIESLAYVAGLHMYREIQDAARMPISLTVTTIPEDRQAAEAAVTRLLEEGLPKLAVTVECPGPNDLGVFHNAGGSDVTEMEARQDVLFDRLKSSGVTTISVGDLGNELGLGSLRPYLDEWVPRIGKGGCSCPCGGGIGTSTEADFVVTGTVSDWACLGIVAALAWLNEDPEVMPSLETQERAMVKASEGGMIDMYGWLEPAVDGCSKEMCLALGTMMRELVRSSLKLEQVRKPWFDEAAEIGWFEKN